MTVNPQSARHALTVNPQSSYHAPMSKKPLVIIANQFHVGWRYAMEKGLEKQNFTVITPATKHRLFGRAFKSKDDYVVVADDARVSGWYETMRLVRMCEVKGALV